jgi:hypothetical protein
MFKLRVLSSWLETATDYREWTGVRKNKKAGKKQVMMAIKKKPTSMISGGGMLSRGGLPMADRTGRSKRKEAPRAGGNGHLEGRSKTKNNSTKKQKTVSSREGGGRGAASNEDITVDTDDDYHDLATVRLMAQKKRAEGVPRSLQRQADTADSVSLLSASNNESSHSSAVTALLHLKEVRELKHRLQKAMDNQQAPYRRNRKSVFEESLMGRDLKAYVKLTLFRGVKFAVKDSHQMTETLIPACFTAMRLDEHKRVGRQSDFSCAILYAISQQRNRVSQEMARIFKGKHYREGGKGIHLLRLEFLTSLFALSS